MNAEHILSRWERVRGVFNGKKPSWFLLLYAARAGAAGLPREKLRINAGVRTTAIHQLVRSLSESGLLKVDVCINRAGRPGSMISITAKGLEFLGLQPIPEKEGSGS